jgi:hypothetical protein
VIRRADSIEEAMLIIKGIHSKLREVGLKDNNIIVIKTFAGQRNTPEFRDYAAQPANSRKTSPL